MQDGLMAFEIDSFDFYPLFLSFVSDEIGLLYF